MARRDDPESVRVELYADPTNGGEPERHVMACESKVAGSGTRYEYGVSVPAARSAGDYTPRLLPWHPSTAVPLEAHEILAAMNRVLPIVWLTRHMSVKRGD